MYRHKPAGLAKHDLRDGGRDGLAKQTIAFAVSVLTIGPGGEFIGCRRMADVGRAAPHDEAEHHLGSALLGTGRTIHDPTV